MPNVKQKTQRKELQKQKIYCVNVNFTHTIQENTKL